MATESNSQGTENTSASAKNQVLVIALDGATWDLLDGWIAQGLLPNLARLVSYGASASLESTLPPITPVAWLTFATGKNAAWHHVFDFFRPLRRRYTDLVPATADLNRQPTLWGILSRRGRKVGMVNVPMTYPPEPVQGFLIPGIPTPDCPDPGYPPCLVDRLRQRGWDLTRNAAVPRESYAATLEYLHDLVDTRAEATCHLLAEQPWDFFMVHFLETDQAGHTFWRFLEQEGSELEDAILSIYKSVDRAVGQIVEAAGDAFVLIMSDHGMGPTRYHINLNNWLLRNGFMHWKRRPATALRRLGYALGINPTRLYKLLPTRILKKLSLSNLRTGLAQITTEHVGHRTTLVHRLMKRASGLAFLSFDDIDWSRTAAYSTGTTAAGLIYLNVAGREPEGIIARDEYHEARDRIVVALERFVDPWTKQPLVRQVHRREMVYHGPYVDDGPDLIVEYHSGEYDQKKGAVFLSTRPVEAVRDANATHRLHGILVLHGADIVGGGQRLASAHIRDIAPTILHLMGEPIPSQLEGRVLEDAFSDSYRTTHQVQYSSEPLEQQAVEEEMTSEELESVLEKLQGLGYIA